MPGPGTWSAGDILTAADLNAIGTWTTYTPVLKQSGTRSATINYAKYCLINKLCFVNVDLTCTTSGSAGSAILVTLPFPVLSTIAGSGVFYDDSLTDVRLLSVGEQLDEIEFYVEESTSFSGLGANPSLALAANDIISFSVMYEIS